jgi:hypothetical protein
VKVPSFWVQIYGEKDRVERSVAEEWTRVVMGAAKWMADIGN